MKHLVTVVGFMAVTFAVQGLSHFVINKEHFAGIAFMREPPIMPLGFAVMVIQGLVLSLAYARLSSDQGSLREAYVVVLAFGLFLGSYIALTEPAKYEAPSITAWMLVEVSASFAQFALFGVAMWLIHRASAPSIPTP